MKLLIIIFILIIFLYLKNREKENFNIFCDKKKDNDYKENKKKKQEYDFFKKQKIIDNHLKKINTSNLPKYIYKSKSLIPFNYSDNSDNNLITIIIQKERIHKLEKLKGGMMH